MKRRSRFMLLCLMGSVFGLLIWNGDQDGYSDKLFRAPANFGGYFSRFSGIHRQQEIGNKTVVLMWTKYYAVKDEVIMNGIFSGRKWDPDCCSGDDMIVTLDQSLLPWATVIVFYNYFGNLMKHDLPKTRSPDQLWVLFSKESPKLSLGLNQFPNQFNWTMSYRRDSDIWSPYGFTLPLESPVAPNKPIMMPGNVPLSQWIANKTDALAGVMSHCPTHSKRERIVKALRNASLSVDIYGGCGNRKICPRTRHSCDHDKFWHDLGVKYRFYFAAENSLCVDYITEKFWRTLQLGMVPLVYGGANYSEFAPPNSFIDMRNFKDPAKVAAYLQFLAEDPDEYSKYFEWRRRYQVRLTDAWHGWCTLCKRARQRHNGDLGKVGMSPNKSYKDLSKWWLKERLGSNKSACTGPYFSM